MAAPSPTGACGCGQPSTATADDMMGVDFFTTAAARFISAAPPTGADLYEYGTAFPRFLATFEPAQILANVARLDWRITQSEFPRPP